MNPCLKTKSHPKDSIIWLCTLSTIVSLVGCSNEMTDEEAPYPISPRTAFEQALENQPNATTPNRVKSSSSAVIQSPSVQCTSSVIRSDAGANENSTNAAVVRLAANANLQDPILVYRTPGTLITQGSLIFVNDMSFGPSGSHVAGTYFFEIHTGDGKTCALGIFISDEDAANKKVLTIQASFP